MRALLSSVASIIRAIMSATAPVLKWCGRTGAWIVDHTARPISFVMEKTGDALIGTADLVGKAASIPGRLVGGLLGGGGASLPMPHVSEDAAHDRRVAQVEKATAALQASRAATAQPIPRTAGPLSPRSLIGELVHAYAQADPVERLALDLDMLPPHIRSWLIACDERTLERLARIGPEACGEFAAGKRRIVGIERPDGAGTDLVDVDLVMAQSAAAPYLRRIADAKAEARVFHA
ncbi:hypothetical protein [Microvirga calopogonii]|uniref:hypothetical protein n=1 Tax=Microvirga calopogonii TaxID=2078013 RepID=UPI000E0DC8E3|nr:hypothetical protein [Microvirga calopogonii]